MLIILIAAHAVYTKSHHHIPGGHHRMEVRHERPGQESIEHPPHFNRLKNRPLWKGEFPHHKGPPPIFQLTQLIFLFLIGLLTGLYLRTRKHLEMIEAEKNKAEIAYLKSQINPHFLFNTFNSIYSLAIKEKADQTANGMLKLSGMMRYVVSETSHDYVPLEKEIDYIDNYIELQKLRLDKSVQLHYLVNGTAENKQIAPLILIPFIENAFKHGVSPDDVSIIDIEIKINDQLELTVKNNKVAVGQTRDEQLGFGIENTRTRLQLLYPNQYHLTIEDGVHQYCIHLILTKL